MENIPGQAEQTRQHKQIRQIKESDILSVAAIYNYYIEHTTASYEESRLGFGEMQSRVNNVLEAGYPWLVAEEEGRIIGYAYAYQWNSRPAYCRTAETTVYLAQGETGKGWGMRLYQGLLEQLALKGIKTVIGGIGLPNPASIALHEKMGFTKVAHFANVGYKFGQWLDVGYWQRHLTDEN